MTQAELDALILNEQDIAKKAYDYNGVANTVSPNYRSLAQSRMRGEDMTQAALDALILNAQDISNTAYDHNGVANPHAPNYRSLA